VIGQSNWLIAKKKKSWTCAAAPTNEYQSHYEFNAHSNEYIDMDCNVATLIQKQIFWKKIQNQSIKIYTE
jgi:hypothetical protein